MARDCVGAVAVMYAWKGSASWLAGWLAALGFPRECIREVVHGVVKPVHSFIAVLSCVSLLFVVIDRLVQGKFLRVCSRHSVAFPKQSAPVSATLLPQT